MMLIDSDVLISHLRGKEVARDWLLALREASGRPSISAVSVTEVTGGMRSGERATVWRLLGSMRVEPVSDSIARRAGELMRKYRRSHSGIGLGDYLIAATAEVRGLSLATLNLKHFPMFRDLQAPFKL